MNYLFTEKGEDETKKGNIASMFFDDVPDPGSLHQLLLVQRTS